MLQKLEASFSDFSGKIKNFYIKDMSILKLLHLNKINQRL